MSAFFVDDDATVRDNAAELAGALRNRPVMPHRKLIEALVVSPAFDDALPQLLITLERATEPIDELVLVTARCFIDRYGDQMAHISTRAAHDATQVGELALRAYAQAADTVARSLALDVIDDLLARAAYAFSETVGEAER